MPPSHHPTGRACTLAIKRTTSPQESDYFITGWNLEDYNWEGDSGSRLEEQLEARSVIPVGNRKIPVFVSSTQLSPVVPILTRGPPVVLPKPAPRVTQPPVKTSVPTVAPVTTNAVIRGTGRYHKQPNGTWYDKTLGIYIQNLPTPGVGDTEVMGPFPPNPFPNEESDVDLGDLLGQLGSAFINAKYAPPTIQPVSLAPTYGTGGMDGSVINPTPALGLPFVDVIPEAGSKGMVYSPRANCGAGGWVKRRRRRKRLATVSDIKDIAALKAVMGPSMLKTWIATHS